MPTELARHEGPTTPVDRGAARWDELATKGVVVVPSFLDADELAFLNRDFAVRGVNPNKNLSTKEVSPEAFARIRPKLEAAAARVRAGGVVDVDAITGGSYFSTALGVNEPWHQDHESYFLYQEHFHYLNFWIPIAKPDAERTNLCVVPMDALLARRPDAKGQLIGNGAAHVLTTGGRSTIHLDDRGGEIALDFDVAELAVVPAVSPGDLVLLRGDILHRTQDRTTERVSVSFRMINSKSIVRKQRLLEGSPIKRRMMLKNALAYAKAIQYFNYKHTDEVTVGKLLKFMRTYRIRLRPTAIALAELAFKWRTLTPT